MAKKAALILTAFVAFLALTACEPKSTVTTTRQPVNCLNENLQVSGFVNPPDATKKVILQRTVGGQWVDFEWYSDFSSAATKGVISDTVGPTGHFELYVARENEWRNARLPDGVVHFRVRTERNGGISPGWYTTFPPRNCTP